MLTSQFSTGNDFHGALVSKVSRNNASSQLLRTRSYLTSTLGNAGPEPVSSSGCLAHPFRASVN